MSNIYSGLNKISGGGGNSLTPQQENKLNKVKIDGDGTKVLADNGEYVEVSSSNIDIKIWSKTSTETYNVNDLVGFENQLYQCITENTDRDTFDFTKYIPISAITFIDIVDYEALTLTDDDRTLFIVNDNGKYSLYSGKICVSSGSGVEIDDVNLNLINKTLSSKKITELDNLNKEQIINDIQSIIGNLSDCNIIGATDIIYALNKLNSQDVNSVGLTDNIITVDYKNGKKDTCDLSTIMSSINIGDLSNVNDNGVLDKQVLAYDIATSKYIPTSIDNTNIIDEAKKYTDDKYKTVMALKPKIVSNKPTSSEAIDNQWYLYNDGTSNCMTIYSDGVEFTMDVGNITLDNYVNKTTDVSSIFTGEELDTSKIADIGALQNLLSIVNNNLDKKVNKIDIIDDLVHSDIDKPVSAKQAKLLKDMIDDISLTISGSGSVVMKKYFDNVNKGDTLTYDSIIPLKDSCIINVFEAEDGSTNLTESFKDFSETTKNDFIGDEIIIDDEGLKIKNEYVINSVFNSDNNLYETNLNDFINNNIISITEEMVQ